MGHVQPFVAIVLGDGPQQDAEQLARAAGATAILRPGQPHPTPLHSPDAVLDLADHGSGAQEEPVIDLAPIDAATGPDELIDLADPTHSGPAGPLHLPDTAVVIDPAEVLDVPAMVAAVHVVLDCLRDVTPACVVATRVVTDTVKLVDGAGTLLSMVNGDDHPWLSAPLAGPLDVISSVAQHHAGPADQVADETGSPSVRPLVEALLRQGVDVRTARI